jgi:hypothetical protein
MQVTPPPPFFIQQMKYKILHMKHLMIKNKVVAMVVLK